MNEPLFKSILRPRILEQLPKPLIEASDARLARALIENHRAWRVRLARAARGVVHTRSGIDWMHAPGAQIGIAITGMAEEEAPTQLADAFRFFSRKRNPIPVTITAGHTSGPPDLIGRLIAWGVQPKFLIGMAADLTIRTKILEYPADLKLSFPNATNANRAKWENQTLHRAEHMRPKRIWHIVAHQKRRSIGHIVLLVSNGVVGLYNLTVHPKAQHQGIGSALLTGACRFAHKLGYAYAVLAADQTACFRNVGFHRVSRFLHTEQPSTDLRGKPSERDLDIACTASLGERGRFCKLLRRYPKALTWQSRNGLTPLHIALASNRPDFACWLIDRGAKIDPETARQLKR